MKATFTFSAITDQGSADYNEDSYCIKMDSHDILVGVFDGVTTVLQSSFENWPSNGYEAAKAAAKVVSLSALQDDPTEILRSINHALNVINVSHGMKLTDPATLCGVVGSVLHINQQNGSISYALIGDSPIIISYRTGGFEVLTSDIFEEFSKRTFLIMQEARSRGIIEPSAQLQYAREQLIANRRKANSPKKDGHGILNGMESALSYIECGSINNLNRIRFIALLTDGILPPVRSTEARKIYDPVVELLSTRGLHALLNHTRELENRDPHLTKPRIKKHDDATGVLITLN